MELRGVTDELADTASRGGSPQYNDTHHPDGNHHEPPIPPISIVIAYPMQSVMYGVLSHLFLCLFGLFSALTRNELLPHRVYGAQKGGKCVKEDLVDPSSKCGAPPYLVVFEWWVMLASNPRHLLALPSGCGQVLVMMWA